MSQSDRTEHNNHAQENSNDGPSQDTNIETTPVPNFDRGNEILDAEARFLQKQIIFRKQQWQQEVQISETIDKRLNEIYQQLKENLKSQDLDRQTQRELGILLQLTPRIREKNDLDIIVHLENALSALLEKHEPQQAVSTNSLESNESDESNEQKVETSNNQNSTSVQKPLLNHKKFRSIKIFRALSDFFFINERRSPKFVYAQQIRRGIQYQVSSQASKSTYLIAGLAVSILLLGALPMIVFVRSRPPALTIQPKSLNEIELVGGENQFNIYVQRERPNAETKKELLRPNQEGLYVISFLDSGELDEVIRNNAKDISTRVSESVNSSLSNSLRQQVEREVIESVAASYAFINSDSVENSVNSSSYIQSIAEDIQQQLEEQVPDSDLSVATIQNIVRDSIANPNEGQAQTFQDFIKKLQETDILPVDSSELSGLIDTSLISDTTRTVVKEELSRFPFDSMTTPQIGSLLQGSIPNESQSDNTGGGETPASGSDAESDSGLNDGLEDLGIDWRYLLVVLAGGAFGGSTFIILKAQNANIYVDEDRFSLFFTGLLKPLSGIALALFLMAALQSEALPVSLKSDSDGAKKSYLFFALSFVAGFSQLLVQDAISKTQNSVIGSSSNRPNSVSTTSDPPLQ